MNRILNHYKTKKFTLVELDAISSPHKNDKLFSEYFNQNCRPVINIGADNTLNFHLNGENADQYITAFMSQDGLRFKMHFKGMPAEDLKQRNFDIAFAAVVVEAFVGEKIDPTKLSSHFEIQVSEDLNLALSNNQAPTASAI
jgi:hypothetical protein